MNYLTAKQLEKIALTQGGVTFRAHGPNQFEVEVFAEGYQVALTDNKVIGDLWVSLNMIHEAVSNDLHVFKTGIFGLYWSDIRKSWYLDQSVLILCENDAHTLAYACRQETIFNWVSCECEQVSPQLACGV